MPYSCIVLHNRIIVIPSVSSCQQTDRKIHKENMLGYRESKPYFKAGPEIVSNTPTPNTRKATQTAAKKPPAAETNLHQVAFAGSEVVAALRRRTRGRKMVEMRPAAGGFFAAVCLAGQNSD